MFPQPEVVTSIALPPSHLPPPPQNPKTPHHGGFVGVPNTGSSHGTAELPLFPPAARARSVAGAGGRGARRAGRLRHLAAEALGGSQPYVFGSLLV